MVLFLMSWRDFNITTRICQSARGERGGEPPIICPHVRRLRQTFALSARRAHAAGFRRPAGLRGVPAGLRRPADDVFVRLRPRHALRGPRRATCCWPACIMFVVAQVPPQRLMSFAVPLYVLGRGAAGGGGGVRHHQEGRQALGQRGRRDPAQRNPEDRHAADAGLVVPEARRPAAAARLRVRRAAAGRAGRPDREAARPGHGHPGAGRPGCR